jgi:hypothetical protein
VIDVPTSVSAGSWFNATIRAVDYWGDTSPGVYLVGLVLAIDSSLAYLPDSHSGGGVITLEDGTGTVAVFMPVGFTEVTLSLEDPSLVGTNARSTSTVTVAVYVVRV